jgi:acyl-CoA reductase-like NAD-dependent aldehyde dehydrogenase/nicotinamidase-related amidase
MAPCLICVDLQRAYLDDPELEPGAGPLLAAVAAWLAAFRDRQLPVLHVRTTVEPAGPALPHWDEPARRRLAHDAETWRFAPAAEPRDGEPIVDKTHYSGFASGHLGRLIADAGATEVILAGVHLHGCIRSTALDASAAGLRVSIAADATATNDPAHAAATRRWLAERAIPFPDLAAWRAGAAGAEPPEAEPAAELAERAFPAWSALEPERRRAALEPLPALLRASADSLADTLASEIHKPRADALAEVEYAARLAERALARLPALPIQAADGLARRVPHGPVLLVTPWNNPLAIPAGKIVPALALGNTAIWKPSEHAPRSSRALLGLLARLELPPGVLELVEGGPATASALAASPRVRAVSITGSLRAGRDLQDRCAGRLVPLQAELGGNNPAVVNADADVAAAAGSIAAGAFSFAGQRCTATRRAIAVGDAYDPLRAALREEISALRPGDPRDADTTFPPVISRAAVARVEAIVDRARSAGATVWQPEWASRLGAGPTTGAGGDRPAGDLPFVPPALIEGADPDSEVVQEESFGPILVLGRTGSLDDAIAQCNGVRQGLVASIHTRSGADAHRFAAEVRAGIVRVNDSGAGADPSLPFGGMGLSGIGPPEHGEGDAEFYGRWQAIQGEYRRTPGADGGGATEAREVGGRA